MLPEHVAKIVADTRSEVAVHGPLIFLHFWNELYAMRRVPGPEHKAPHLCLECQPLWFDLATCSHCKNGLLECTSNPYFMRKIDPYSLKPLGGPSTIDTEGSSERSEDGEPSTRTNVGRGRGKSRSTLVELDAATLAEAIARYKERGQIAIVAKEFNVQPSYLSAELKKLGIEVKRGGILAARVKAPVVYMTDSDTLRAKLLYRKGSTLVALSRKYNVPANIISEQLKALGVKIRKGKQ